MKIHQQPKPSNRIKWPELYFSAEANREPFQEVLITTAEKEFVKLHKGNITVGIKADVKDDDILWYALDMVADALDKLNSKDGVVYFESEVHQQAEYLH